MDRPALIVHGHFYQPPRENPWTGAVDREPSAAPYHDWNERIDAECYRTNAFARVFDQRGLVTRIVNNYELLSYNFGPTLLSWLERSHSDSYRRIIDADRRSLATRGHGNAIAQGYNHVILPLCTDRDLVTQVRWGLAEFRHRYDRESEALWLPETACDARTLGALIDAGLRYALLSPGQADRVREGEQWRDVSDGSIDPRRAYRYVHPDGSGRSIALFFYDGAMSRAVAFEGALHSSNAFVERALNSSNGAGSLVQVVTDGESYGHHFKHGERCLAHALSTEAERRGLWVTNFGAWLDAYPAQDEVTIKSGDDGLGTSWSCAHGVGRWFRDCGCQTGGDPSWNQSWRGPLRAALDQLRDEAGRFYEEAAGALCTDPWALRDHYVELMLDPAADRGAFFEQRAGARVEGARAERLLALLESQRNSMTMYTSCGWFFSDLAGIETQQVLRYAGRLVDQLEALGAPSSLEAWLEALAEAQSNRREEGNGADIYRRYVRPSRRTRASVAAHITLCRIPCELGESGEVAEHDYTIRHHDVRCRGRTELTTALISLRERATGSASSIGVAAVRVGATDVRCAMREFEASDSGEERFDAACARAAQALTAGSLLELIVAVGQSFGPDGAGFEHVLPDARAALVRALLERERRHHALQLDAMLEEQQPLIDALLSAELPIPDELVAAAGIALSRRLNQALNDVPAGRYDPPANARLIEVTELARRIGCRLDTAATKRRFESELDGLVYRVAAGTVELSNSGSGGPVVAALRLVELVEQLGIELDRSRAQERMMAALAEGLSGSPEFAQLMTRLGIAPRC